MANPAYLQLVRNPLQGQATAPGWVGWIEVSQVRYDTREPKPSGTQNGGSRRGEEVTVLKEFDSSSSVLFESMSKNRPFDSMTIDLVGTDPAFGPAAKASRRLRIECTGVRVMKIQTVLPNTMQPAQASDPSSSLQSVRLTCASIKLSATRHDENSDRWSER